jgi:hypothetical protein
MHENQDSGAEIDYHNSEKIVKFNYAFLGTISRNLRVKGNDDFCRVPNFFSGAKLWPMCGKKYRR